MDAQNKEIGARIRAARLERHMTQAQLSGNSITRNMLSMIENGNAAPSLSTLIELAKQLNVSIGYFFATGDEEVAQFLKMSRIAEIRALRTAGKYSECIQLCTSLARPDDEIRMIVAEAHLSLSQRACQRYALATALEHLETAQETASKCAYIAASVGSTVDYVTTMIHSVNLPEIPQRLAEPEHFPAAQIPAELFAYMAALRLLRDQKAEEAEMLRALSLIHTPVYCALIDAQIAMQRQDHAGASTALRQLIALPSLGFFTKYHTLDALEQCASSTGDFKTAYQFSTQKVRLFEQFSK